jgi:hypothetical protein
MIRSASFMPIDSNGDYISSHDEKLRAAAQKAAYHAKYEGGYNSPDHAAANCGHYNAADIERFRSEFQKAMRK